MKRIRALYAESKVITIDERETVDQAVGRSLIWKEVAGSLKTEGLFRHRMYEATVPDKEVNRALGALAANRE